MKKILGILIFFTLLTIAVSACTLSRSSNTTTGPNPIHMDNLTFKQASITIQKGQVVTLINDAAVVHVIANGTWNGTTPHPGIESGAPTINNLQVNGNDTSAIGPFNTAGTFQIYCTVHPGMKMTIIVK
ncbi:hypothetical protein ccbrp13_55620 [Ktedonobacteria bacterium brp13]|nr:hypothetical protein ccbrp13_55620 [Ktedonobacteria bacterium brp13]